MKVFTALILMFSASTASADPGHILSSGTHDHWVAGIAIGAAIATAIWGALKGKSDTAEDASDGATDTETAQEA